MTGGVSPSTASRVSPSTGGHSSSVGICVPPSVVGGVSLLTTGSVSPSTNSGISPSTGGGV